MLSRNGVFVHLSTDDIIDTPYLYGTNLHILNISTPDEDGAKMSLIIVLNEQEQIDTSITFVNSPDGSGTQAPVIDVGVDPDYLAQLKAAFDAHPVISQYFSVTIHPGDPALHLHAKVWGVSGVFYSESDWTGAGGHTQTFTLESQIRQDLFTNIEVSVEETYGTGVYTKIVDRMFKPHIHHLPETPPQIIDNYEFKGLVKIDVQKYIAPRLRKYIPEFPLPFIAPFVNERQINKRFAIKAQNYYNNNLQGNIVYIPTFRVIAGGLNTYDAAEYLIDLGLFATNFSNNDKRWLTYRPNTREVLANQNHYLYWLNWKERDPGEVYKLEAKVYYTDGTSSSYQNLVTDTDSEQYDTLMFAAGFDYYNLAAVEPLKTAYKYKLRLTGGVDGGYIVDLVKEITYNLLEPSHLDLVVFWKNSFNAVESSLMRGERKLNTDTKSSIAERMPLHVEDAFPELNNTRIITNTTTNSITIESGPMSAEEIAAHRDMLRTKEVWFAHTNPNSRVYTYKLRDGSFEMGYKNDQGQHVHGIKFTIDFEDEINFSNLSKEWR